MNTLKHVGIIWYREILRYWRDKPRIVGSLAMPFFFLIIFGSGLSSSIGQLMGGTAEFGIDFKKFMFPGIIGMTTLFTSMFSGLSIVRDKEYGFLKEILVAPVDRLAVAGGKILGGSTVTMIQATLLFLFAPLVGVGVTPLLVLKIWGLVFLGSLGFTSLGTFVGNQLDSAEGFQMVMNFLIFPMFFLSGAFFPLKDIPSWMGVLVRINPFSYVVDSMRQLFFISMGMPQAMMERLPEFGLGISLLDVRVTILMDLGIMAFLSFSLATLAVRSFHQME
ncbi:ABC transporter permease [Candidatus Bipolaricaulota bacterium]|nr:ABC transporter permease [Candidatus Bipolaricaulota bacterium]